MFIRFNMQFNKVDNAAKDMDQDILEKRRLLSVALGMS